MRYSDAKPEIIQKIHKLCENMDEDREVTEKKSSVWMVSKLLPEFAVAMATRSLYEPPSHCIPAPNYSNPAPTPSP